MVRYRSTGHFLPELAAPQAAAQSELAALSLAAIKLAALRNFPPLQPRANLQPRHFAARLEILQETQFITTSLPWAHYVIAMGSLDHHETCLLYLSPHS